MNEYEHDRFAEIVYHLKRGPVLISMGEWLACIKLKNRIAELSRKVPGTSFVPLYGGDRYTGAVRCLVRLEA